jgi:hypothetical protein
VVFSYTGTTAFSVCNTTVASRKKEKNQRYVVSKLAGNFNLRDIAFLGSFCEDYFDTERFEKKLKETERVVAFKTTCSGFQSAQPRRSQ